MKVVEVKVGELNDFISSKEYSLLDIKPISPLRAISQYNNPFASASDLALIYAYEGSALLGFAGLLPDLLNDGHGFAASNSGWWVNPGKGNTIGFPLLMRALKGCGQKMFLTDCTDYTRTLLLRTGYFEFFPENVGKRWFLRSYFGSKFRRESRSKLMTCLAGNFDRILNSTSQLLFTSKGDRIVKEGITIRITERLDESLSEFLDKNSDGFFLKQSIEKLNWIAGYPWLTTRQNQFEVTYPFSCFTENFKQHFLIIGKGGQTIAVIMVSVRDNHATLPYVYYNQAFIDDVVTLVTDYLLQIHADSLLVFNRDLIKAFDKLRLPALYVKKVTRYSGYSKTLAPFFQKNRIFQDGEGDIAFT